MRRSHLILIAALATAFGAKAIGGNAGVDYPSDYRSWQHVKSMIIQPGHALEGPFGLSLPSG